MISTTTETLLVQGDPAEWNLNDTFRELREQAPVQPVVLPGELRAWLVTDIACAREALADPRLANDPRRLPEEWMGFGGRRYPDDIFAAEGRHLLNSDGLDHQRLRSVLAPVLSRSHAQACRRLIEDISQDLLDRMSECPDEMVDLVAGYARPLSTQVTAAVLGVHPDHLPQLSALTLSMINAEDPEQVERERVQLFRLWVRILAEKRRDPSDDLLTHLLNARSRGDISAQELASVAWGLFSGGISPSTTLIAAGAVELLHAPQLLPALAEPGSTLIEELLRVTSPFPVATWRFALTDVTLGETVIPQGSVVLISLAGANRDPRTYPDPDELTLDRAGRHLAFGLGSHYCPGAHLARLQTTIALDALFTRFPDLSLAIDRAQLRWHGVLVERCYDSVPVRLRTR